MNVMFLSSAKGNVKFDNTKFFLDEEKIDIFLAYIGIINEILNNYPKDSRTNPFILNGIIKNNNNLFFINFNYENKIKYISNNNFDKKAISKKLTENEMKNKIKMYFEEKKLNYQITSLVDNHEYWFAKLSDSKEVIIDPYTGNIGLKEIKNEFTIIVSGNDVSISKKNKEELNNKFNEINKFDIIKSKNFIKIFNENNKLKNYFIDQNKDIKLKNIKKLSVDELMDSSIRTIYTFFNGLFSDAFSEDKIINLIVSHKNNEDNKRIILSKSLCSLIGFFDQNPKILEESLKTDLIRKLFEDSEDFEEDFEKFFEKINKNNDIDFDLIDKTSFFIEYVKVNTISIIDNMHDFLTNPPKFNEIRAFLTNYMDNNQINKKVFEKLKIKEIKNIIRILNSDIYKKNKILKNKYIKDVISLLLKIVKNNDPYVNLIKIEIFNGLFIFIENIMSNENDYFDIKKELEKLINLCIKLHSEIKENYSVSNNDKIHELFKKEFEKIKNFDAILNVLKLTVDSFTL
jgi:hypothetical protein